MTKMLLLSAAAAIAFSGAASAASCDDLVSAFAQTNGLNIAMPTRPGQAAGPASAPPTAESRGLAATDKLAASGGVIKPPDTGSAMTVSPPPMSDKMSTAPAIKPATPTGPVASRPVEVDAAKRAQAEAMLYAAKSASQEGKQEQCLQRLEQAQRLLKGGS